MLRVGVPRARVYRRRACRPACLLVLSAAALLAGCGSSSSDGPSARELALERAQFVQLTSGLSSARPAVQAEAASSRGVWPSIASGLPNAPSPALRGAVAQASVKAASIAAPPFLAARRSLLTGPAAGIAGLYESYERLVPRSWRLVSATLATIASGPASAARYARTNSSFYIDAIYDGHFNLSLVGHSLVAGYAKLGGAAAFGPTLPSSRLATLAAAYSIPSVRLEPHPAGAAREG